MADRAASSWRERLTASRSRIAATGIAAVLSLGGVSAIGYAAADQQHPPQPPPSPAGASEPGPAASAIPTPTHDQGSPASASDAKGPVLPRATPKSIRVPAIDVSSPVNTVGLNPDGTMAVPQPGPHYDHTAWYKYSPTPGELGPSVITGHIDSAESGPSVFFRLGDLRTGDKVRVTRRDGKVAVFAVDKVADYPKDNFPTFTVYGTTDRAELRLITCGGSFNDTIGHYRKNIVAYAHLIRSTTNGAD